MATTQDACSTLRCLRMGSITFDPRQSEVVDLNLLERGMPGITPRWGASLAEAATVCLEEHAIASRLRRKTKQVAASGGRLSGVVAIVDFGDPRSRVKIK